MLPLNNKKLMELRHLVPVFVLCLVISAILLIPMKVMEYGSLPSDDALGRAAKVVSEKDWNEILILRSDIKMDNHHGWDAILGAIHKLTDWPQDTLVVFSIISLFVLFCLVPALLLTRPEAWPITLIVIVVANPSFIGRLLLGRPYIFIMFALIVLCFLWPRLRDKKTPYNILIILTSLIAVSTWIHCSWYLFALPVICFFLAREWRAGFRICIVAIAGIAIGSMLTGSPYLYFREALSHLFRVFSNHTLQRMLVVELRSFTGDALMIIAVLGMLAWRKIRGDWDMRRIDNPVFILAMSSWVLGFVSQRFWLDWGIPAVCVWMAQEFQGVLNSRIDFLSWRRLLLTIAVAGVLYIGITNDVHDRWTANLTKEYLSVDNPNHALWLPDTGGIVYSDDMTIFFDTFFKNPHAPWRYILGFEPTMMPPEDLAIYRRIQWNLGAYESFEPWVKKMKPEDRLILRRTSELPPEISGLEWNYTARKIWIGRVPGEEK